MGEDADLGAREATAVDDGGVVERIGDDQVACPGKRRDHAEVGHVAGVEDEGRLPAQEVRELGFEGLVDVEVAVDEARAARRAAELARRAYAGLHDLGVMREVEVVAAREEQHLPTVDGHARSLGALHDAHAAMGSARADGGEPLVGGVVQAHEARRTSGRSSSPSPPTSRKPPAASSLASA